MCRGVVSDSCQLLKGVLDKALAQADSLQLLAHLLDPIMSTLVQSFVQEAAAEAAADPTGADAGPSLRHLAGLINMLILQVRRPPCWYHD